MAAVRETTTAPTTSGTRHLAWLVLAAAIAQVVAPVITIIGPGASPGSGSGPDLLITPVGWAFSIWGVIYTLAIVQAVAALLGSTRPVPRRFQLDQVALYLAGVVWIAMAALDSSTATFLALAAMLVAAVDGVLTLARSSLAPRWFALLTRAAFGIFAGWVSAAFFVNASTAMVDWGWFAADEVTWQLAVLVVAAATIAVLVLVGRLAGVAAAGVWALVGIVVTGLDDGTTTVVAVAAVAAVCVAAAGALAVRRQVALGA